MKAQKGKCPHCHLYIRSVDLVEVDHIIPRSLGGKDIYTNLQLIHRHCHDAKTATDIKSQALMYLCQRSKYRGAV
ncbi:HNH endonuclease [Phormidesmis priestleyi]